VGHRGAGADVPPRVAAAPETALARRSAGLLLHVTSLPGGHGIGDLGAPAREFVDFLAAAGQRWWQTLPVGPVGRGDSPYDGPSAFAGNPLLIDLEQLAADGLLARRDLRPSAGLGHGRVAYRAAARFKETRLRRAFAAAGPDAVDLDRAPTWLHDYALYQALTTATGTRHWTTWPRALRRREPGTLEHARTDLAHEIRYQVFVQGVFEHQWRALREHAHERHVRLIGDVPILVALSSADVWAHQDLFQLDGDGRPTERAGVPPDYFSRSGQLWGNPLYRWPAMRRDRYGWWIDRLRSGLDRFDALRLDHFIGFQRYWAVPRGARTARRGRWRRGPGADFLGEVQARLGRPPLIAEDLGAVTGAVETLRDRFELPGMKVLQFALGDARTVDPPAAFPDRSVVYTGTHDNDTTAGWYRSSPAAQRAFVRRYLGASAHDVPRALVELALACPCNVAIVPLQDLLGLGSRARMNRPGTARGNWRWRLNDPLDSDLAADLQRRTQSHGRA